MRFLVTGATGFIGSYLIPDLLDRGHSVVATDVLAEPPHFADLEAVDYLQTDLSREVEIYKLMSTVKVDCVIHLAALLAEFCEADPLRGYRVNVMATLALLDACVLYGIRRFIMTSSPSVYGRGLDEPVADDANKVPETVYGQTKLACEHILAWFQRAKGLSVGAVRFPWVYGPGRKTGLTAEYSSKLLDAIGRGEDLVIESPDAVGDWLYVKDAVKAISLLAERDDNPSVAYNIMSGVYSVSDAMSVAQGIYPDTHIEIRKNQAFHYPYASSFDDSRARTEIGWSPEYPIERGIKEHVEADRKSLEVA